MEVTCEKCHARFRLDENRIKGDRAKVRCSRCQQVFWVEREKGDPGASSSMAGERAAAPEPRPLMETKEPLPVFRALEEEPEDLQAAARASLPKPSILLSPPAKRSPWPWILLSAALLSVLVMAGVVWWFWGYNWVAQSLKITPKPPAPAAKVAEPAKVETVSPPPAPAAVAADLKNLELITQEERYRGLVNIKGGQLLVIQGKVKNSATQPRGPIQLKVILTDPQQKVVSEREFYAGTVIFDDELQKLNPEEINHWLDTPGGRAQKQILEPGETQTFMVAFFGVPQNLSGYGYKMQITKGPVASNQPRRK